MRMHLFVLCPSGGIDLRHLPPKILGAELQCPPPATQPKNSGDALKDELIRVLRQTAGNQSEAARLLGCGRNTLTRKIKELGMEREGDR